MTLNVSFVVTPGIKPGKAIRRTSFLPLSPTTKYGVDMLKNALKDVAGGGG